jgi:hypothetical protein
MYRRGRANRLALRASPGETPDCLRSCRLPAGRKWLRPQVVAANGLRHFTAGRRIADTPRRCHQKLRGTPDRPQRPPPAAIAHGGEPTDLRPPEVCSSSSRRPTGLFSAAGYPLDADTWLRAFFAAGGRFDEATKVAKLIKEMQRGTQHRIKARYQPEILSVLRERAAETA